MLTQGTFRYLQETGGGRDCELKGDHGEVLEGAATAVLAFASPQCCRSAAGGLLQDASTRTDKDAGAGVGRCLAQSDGGQIGGPEEGDGNTGVGEAAVGRKRSGGRRGAAFSRETSRKIDEGPQPLTTQEGTAWTSSAASERAPSGSEDPIDESAALPAAAQRGGQVGDETLEASAGAASKSEKAESCSVAGGHCEAGWAMAVDAEVDNASAGAPVGKGCGWAAWALGMARVPAPLTCPSTPWRLLHAPCCTAYTAHAQAQLAFRSLILCSQARKEQGSYAGSTIGIASLSAVRSKVRDSGLSGWVFPALRYLDRIRVDLSCGRRGFRV